jgi:hypothetical protein
MDQDGGWEEDGNKVYNTEVTYINDQSKAWTMAEPRWILPGRRWSSTGWVVVMQTGKKPWLEYKQGEEAVGER